MVKLKIRKLDEDDNVVDLEAGDNVVPYCGFLYAMWTDIQVSLKHQEFYRSHGYYDLKTYIKLLYCTPNVIKNTRLKNSLWWRDKQGAHSIILNNEVSAPGQYWRTTRAASSKVMELTGDLILDCFDVARPLPENVSVNLQFYPNEPKKCLLHSDAAFKPVIQLEEFYLLVPRLIPKSSALNLPARIPWVNTQVHRFTFPSGGSIFGTKSLIQADCLPRRCYIVLLTESQANGNIKECRQEFNPLNVKQVLVTVNNEPVPYYNGYEVDYSKNQFSLVYDGLFKELGNESTIDVTREEFTGGFVVYAMDLTQKNLSSEYYPQKKSGQIKIEIHFASDTTTNLSILVFLEEERILSFSKKKEFIDKPAQS